MIEQKKQPSKTKLKSEDTSSKLQIILAEYGHQQKRLENSLSVINQTFTIYIATFAFLGSAIVGVINFQTSDKRLTYIGCGLISLVATLASSFLFIRHHKTRMEQTDAERALSRLRNYFVEFAPDLRIYLSGTFNDSWATPYTHRRKSASFWGWIIVILLIGITTCFTIAAFLFATLLGTVLINWGISLFCGILVIYICYSWLNQQLKMRRNLDKPRFPKVEINFEAKVS